MASHTGFTFRVVTVLVLCIAVRADALRHTLPLAARRGLLYWPVVLPKPFGMGLHTA
jgi:hypothetical protein